MTDAPKLKPCPFCGNADELLYGFGGRIFCDECGCEGPFSHFFKGDWNTRADLIDMDVLRSVEAASRPFVAAVFNDNGDVTVSTGHLTTGRWLKLCATISDLRAMMEKLK